MPQAFALYLEMKKNAGSFYRAMPWSDLLSPESVAHRLLKANTGSLFTTVFLNTKGKI